MSKAITEEAECATLSDSQQQDQRFTEACTGDGSSSSSSSNIASSASAQNDQSSSGRSRAQETPPVMQQQPTAATRTNLDPAVEDEQPESDFHEPLSDFDEPEAQVREPGPDLGEQAVMDTVHAVEQQAGHVEGQLSEPEDSGPDPVLPPLTAELLQTSPQPAESLTAESAEAEQSGPEHVDTPLTEEVMQAQQPTESEETGPEFGEPPLTEEIVRTMTARAEELKAEGNVAYGAGQYQRAADLYNDAVDAAPPGTAAIAVYCANLAACHLKLGLHAEAAQACSVALSMDAHYVKALMRRSEALEQLDDLEHALADARKVLEVDGSSAWAAATIARVQPVVAARTEKMKDEMLGKLKDLGNTLLGKFGMSLDNFKAEKDPASGSYSIKFQQ
ncbi:MAG: hypothetical protein WDW38_002019 [Sanguina aurantia]